MSKSCNIALRCFIEWFNQFFIIICFNISVILCIQFKKQLYIIVLEILEGGCFMKNFRFFIFCKITQEPPLLQTFNKFAVIKYH